MSYLFRARKYWRSILVFYIIFFFVSSCTPVKQTSSINNTSANEQRIQPIQNGMPDSEDAAPKKMSIAPEILKQYVGTYELASDFNVTVTLEGDRLITQAPGQDKIPVYAMSDTKFFYKVADATVEFFKDDKGIVSHLLILQDGRFESFAPNTGYKKGPLTGTWTATADGPDGNPLEVTYVFEALGKALIGTVRTRLGGGPFAEGKIDGDKISFVVRLDASTTIETTGTVSGDVINFTQRNGERVIQFTAKRVDE